MPHNRKRSAAPSPDRDADHNDSEAESTDDEEPRPKKQGRVRNEHTRRLQREASERFATTRQKKLLIYRFRSNVDALRDGSKLQRFTTKQTVQDRGNGQQLLAIELQLEYDRATASMPNQGKAARLIVGRGLEALEEEEEFDWDAVIAYLRGEITKLSQKTASDSIGIDSPRIAPENTSINLLEMTSNDTSTSIRRGGRSKIFRRTVQSPGSTKEIVVNTPREARKDRRSTVNATPQNINTETNNTAQDVGTQTDGAILQNAGTQTDNTTPQNAAVKTANTTVQNASVQTIAAGQEVILHQRLWLSYTGLQVLPLQ